MTSIELYKALLNAYSLENLTELTRKILKLYESNNNLEIKRMLTSCEGKLKDKISKRTMLSKLMMRFHPDRSIHSLKEIERLFNEEPDRLKQYQCILNIQQINPYFSRNLTKVNEEIFTPKYFYDEEEPLLSYYEQEEEYDPYSQDVDLKDHSFYAVFKRHYYGPRAIEVPYFLLEDIDEVELPNMDIDELDGIEHCLQLQKLDLSQNGIYSVSELSGLKLIEELYLADNIIEDIEALSNLQKLKILDLSANPISDIEPLFELERLEYLNLSNTRVSVEQIEKIRTEQLVIIF